MSEIEKKWYVLRAISGKEAKVKEYLEADIKSPLSMTPSAATNSRSFNTAKR